VPNNLTNIEPWRITLPLTQRLKLNHPNSVWRNFKKAMAPETDKPAKSTLRDSVADLEEENARKDQRIKELEEELERARQKRLPKSLDDLVGSIGDHIMSGADDLPINEGPEFFSRLGKIIKQVEAMLEEGPPAPATPAG
jgi:hypothetical protein